MQDSWGAEILDNAKQFDTLFFFSMLGTNQNNDLKLPAAGSETRCHIPFAQGEKNHWSSETTSMIEVHMM